MALDAVRERRVDERVGVVLVLGAAAVVVRGPDDAPRVRDDREGEDLGRERPRPHEGRIRVVELAVQYIQHARLVPVPLRHRAPVAHVLGPEPLRGVVLGDLLAVSVDLGLPARQAPVVAKALNQVSHTHAAGLPEVRERHRRVVPERLPAVRAALDYALPVKTLLRARWLWQRLRDELVDAIQQLLERRPLFRPAAASITY